MVNYTYVFACCPSAQDVQIINTTSDSDSHSPQNMSKQIFQRDHEIIKELFKLVLEDLECEDGDVCVVGTCNHESRREAMVFTDVLCTFTIMVLICMANLNLKQPLFFYPCNCQPFCYNQLLYQSSPSAGDCQSVINQLYVIPLDGHILCMSLCNSSRSFMHELDSWENITNQHHTLY